MPPTATTTCPICGAAADGAYCARCGAALVPRSCEACGAELSPVAAFCHRCGREAARRPSGQAASESTTESRTPWLVAGIIIILLLAFVIANLMPGKEQPRRADMANVGNAPPGGGIPQGQPEGPLAGATPPDISALTPEQRFVRLSDRVLTAAAGGDSATATTFAPMAIAAYGMLPETNASLRYRAAMINARTGNYPGALALADSILTADPSHLLGLLIRGEVATLQRDAARVAAARDAFNAAYANETARPDRPEYQVFRTALDAFRNSGEQ